MKIENIELKGERKAKNRKKQGKRYIKPVHKKSENAKVKNVTENPVTEEKTVKNVKNVNNSTQKTTNNKKETWV